MLLGTVAFAAMHAAMKVIALHYPPIQVAAIRGLAALPLVILWLLLAGEARSIGSVRFPLQLLRGIVSIGVVYFTAVGLGSLKLAEAYTISFLGPILIAALSMSLLGEHVHVRRWVAVLVGFCGVVVALRPSGGGMISIGGLAMLASAVCFAVSALIARVLVRSDSTLAMIFWVTVSVGVGASLLALPHWVPLSSDHLWTLPLIGATGALGQFAFTEAVRRAPVAVVAPYNYLLLIWGACLDWILWGSGLTYSTLIGAALIIAAGLFLYRTEVASSRSGGPV